MGESVATRVVRLGHAQWHLDWALGLNLVGFLKRGPMELLNGP
jgi:hypothetical protein